MNPDIGGGCKEEMPCEYPVFRAGRSCGSQPQAQRSGVHAMAYALIFKRSSRNSLALLHGRNSFRPCMNLRKSRLDTKRPKRQKARYRLLGDREFIKAVSL